MSNYQDEGPLTELSNVARRPSPGSYRSNRYVSGTNTPNINSPTSSGHASGTHTPCTYAPSSYVHISTNDPWDVSGHPLSRSRSRQPSDYGTALPILASNDDWNMANEIEQTILLQPTSPVPDRGPEYTEAQQPFPQVNIQQQRLNSHDVAARVPDTAKQVQHYYAPTPPAPQQAAPTPTTAVVIAPVSVPEGAVSVVKEVILEPQPANTKRRVSFTTNTKPPVTTIQAMAAQASTLCQLNTVQESTSDGSDQSENGGVVNQHSTGNLSVAKIERRASFRRSLRHAGRRIGVSEGFLASLRLGVKPVVFRADRILSDWKTYLSEFDQKHDNMEDGFDPFQDVIEDAFDAKYKDLLGEGRFLVDEEEEAELPAEVPVEMPVQEVQAVPTKDANTWIAHKKAEEAFSEIRDIHTGSARRRLSASEFVVHPPKPRTYPAGLTYLRTPLCHACASPCPPVLAPVPQAALQPVGPVSIKSESTEVEQHYSTPDPVESPEPMQIEGKVKIEQPKTPSPPQIRLTRAANHRSGESTSPPLDRRSSVAQPVQEPTPQGRKDSAQTGSPPKPPAKPPARYRRPSRNSERYPSFQNGERHVKPRK